VIDVRAWEWSNVLRVLTLYHIVVMSIRLGATALSKTPKSTLVVTSPAQFFAADVQTTITPHYARRDDQLRLNVVNLPSSERNSAETYKDNHRPEILRRRQYLHSICMRELTTQVAHVEYHSQQAELSSADVRIVLQSHNVGIIYQGLV
jgi:uncharacterized membrane protein YcgQ (UPF0703/DUF1980 family)